MQGPGKLQNALAKLDMLYKKKIDQIPEEQLKQVDIEKEEKKQVDHKIPRGDNTSDGLQQKGEKQVNGQTPQIVQATQSSGVNYPVAAKDKKTIRDEKSERKRRQMCMRKAAGTIWEDPSLADWPDNDYRLFCGNLGNEVSDEILSNAFRKYKSFCRARVIRDKRTMKTKGYGFVAFLNPQDYLKAFNEMNNKYVGNRPIKIERSEWKERSYQNKKKDGLEERFIKARTKKVKKAQM